MESITPFVVVWQRERITIASDACYTIQYFQNIDTNGCSRPGYDERMIPMKEKYIEEIMKLIKILDENQLLYILTFIKKLFGSH